jgi:hypothetical protein
MTTEEHPTAGDHRVQFDFEIDFSNGGGIQGQGFRLDIDGDDISDEELAVAIVETHLSTSATRIRAGAAALAAAGAAFLAYPALRPWHDEGTVAGAIASMSSTAWVTAHFFAMLGFILMPLGMLALRAALAASPAEPLALTAAVLAWIGSGLVLPYYGAEDFGLHVIAGSAGSRAGLLSLVHAVRYQPLAVTIFAVGLLLLLAAAAILAAIAVWRSHVLPRTSAILFAAGLALFLPQFFSPADVRIAHGILLAAGSIILAAALWASADRPRAAATPPVQAAQYSSGWRISS